MDPYLRILRAVPVIHPATVVRMIVWPPDEEVDQEAEVLDGLARAWAQLHPRAATAHDVLAWARKQIPGRQIAVILGLRPQDFVTCRDEIDAWVARGIIAPVPAPIDDPGARADVLQRRRLLSRL